MIPALSILALLFHGLMAGLFYAYSISVMWALDAIEPAQAVAAMRSVNRKILNPWFLPVFVLTSVPSLAVGLLLLLGDGHATAGILFLAAAAVYFLGCFVVTMAANVPLNNALEAGAVDWAGFSPRWQRLNHLRSLACAASLVLAAAGLALA